MPLSLPNQQRQSTEDGKYHIPQTCSPQAHLGSAITVLNTKDSWLPQARDAKPHVSPLWRQYPTGFEETQVANPVE